MIDPATLDRIAALDEVPTEARRALAMFQQVVPLVQGSGHSDAATVLDAAQQYIANQDALGIITIGKVRTVLHVNPLAPRAIAAIGPVLDVAIGYQRDVLARLDDAAHGVEV